jgi:hypothetical protein
MCFLFLGCCSLVHAVQREWAISKGSRLAVNKATNIVLWRNWNKNDHTQWSPNYGFTKDFLDTWRGTPGDKNLLQKFARDKHIKHGKYQTFRRGLALTTGAAVIGTGVAAAGAFGAAAAGAVIGTATKAAAGTAAYAASGTVGAAVVGGSAVGALAVSGIMYKVLQNAKENKYQLETIRQKADKIVQDPTSSDEQRDTAQSVEEIFFCICDLLQYSTLLCSLLISIQTHQTKFPN